MIVAKTLNAKKVLFLSSWFPNRITPANGDFVERHALAVSEICKTAVLYVCPDRNIRGRFMEIFEIQKKELFEVIIYFRKIDSGLRILDRMINNLLYGAGYLIGYLIVLKEIGKPDVIHANIIVPVSRIALYLHRITGIPYIISEHWTIYLSEARKQLRRNYDKPVSKAFAIVPVTNNLKQALISFGYDQRYFIVPNVVDTNLFHPGIRNDQGKKRLLHVSSMKEHHKNITGIIRAVIKLLGLRNDFIFIFAGDASADQKNMVSDAGFTKYIEFVGEVEHSKVAEIMRDSDALVMFSNVENLPCVILEAISSGLPVISTSVGGISEWINESNGILVEPGDETALCKAMDYILTHYSDYNKEHLHEFAVKNFSHGIIAAMFLDIYNKASIKSKE